MEMNENLVTEVTENVENTTEETAEQVTEPVKLYSEEEFREKYDTGVKTRLARQEAKIRKEYEDYNELFDVLKAGTGEETVRGMINKFSSFYRDRGFDIPEKPIYSSKDAEILARAEADEIIELGFDEVVEEADRLNAIGVENMTARDKALFIRLTDHIKKTETSRELSKLGVSEDVYGSDEFKSFASKFSSKTPIKEIYEIYNKTQPKKEIKTMGSIKQTTVDTGVKDFYSRDEAMKFTREDFDKNPALFEAVQKSMLKW